MDLECVLFVCHGNINRSIAAEFIWRDRIHSNVKSCGFRALNRPISKRMRRLLFDIRLPRDKIMEYRSKSISKELMDWATVIFCMTYNHRNKLILMNPEHRDKIYLLPKAIGKDRIVDPGFSSGIKDHRIALKYISDSIDAINCKV